MKVKRTKTRQEKVRVEYDHEDIEKILEEHARQFIPCHVGVDQAKISATLDGGDRLCRAIVVVHIVEVEDE